MGKPRARGVIGITPRPGVRKAAGGVHPAGEYVRRGVTGLAAGLSDQQQRGDGQLVHEAEIDDPAHIEQHRHGLPAAAEDPELPLLLFREIVIPRDLPAVRRLAGGPRDHIDQGIRLFRIFRPDRQVGFPERQAHMSLIELHEVSLASDGVVDPADPPLPGVVVRRVILVQPARIHDLIACRAKARVHADRVAAVHVAAAHASLDRVSRAEAVQAQPHSGRERQKPVVLQQYHALGGGSAGDGA